MVRVCLVLREIAKLFSKVGIPFCIPTSNEREGFYCYISMSAFGIVSVLDIGHCNRLVSCADSNSVVIYGVNVFSDDYMLSVYLSGGASVEVFCPFFNSLFCYCCILRGF